MALFTGFYGVFAPNGELEAVEITEGGATSSALNLAPPDLAKRRMTNRTVRPVVVLDEMLEISDADIERIISRVKARIHADSNSLHAAIGAELLAQKKMAKDPGSKTEL